MELGQKYVGRQNQQFMLCWAICRRRWFMLHLSNSLSERHKAHFYALVDEIQGRTPLIVDESGSDVVRLRVASYDPQPYFNPDAPPYLYYKPNKYSAPRRVKKARKAVMDVVTKQRTYSLIIIIQKKQIDITVGRAVWKSIGQALASEFGPEEGLRLFHLVTDFPV